MVRGGAPIRYHPPVLEGRPVEDRGRGGTENRAAWPARRRARWRGPLLAAACLLAAGALAAGGVAALRARSAAAASRKAPSVAVLPFQNLGGDPSEDYFGDGLSEEIRNALSAVDGLRVTGRTSSFSFKGKDEDVRAIGHKLGVDAVLTGTVRRAGGRVRITAQLVDVAEGFPVWSRSFDRDPRDAFAVQEEIAEAVAIALRSRLARQAQAARGVSRAPEPEAFQQVLLGRQFLSRGTPADYRRAVSAFERAIEADPAWAPAWAGLAQALGYRGDYADTMASMAEDKRLALSAAEHALSLDPELPEGYVARGFLRASDRRDWAGARADLERALAIQPGNADAHRILGAWVLASTGRLDDAIPELQRATELDPLAPDNWVNLGYVLLSAGRLPAARRAIDRSLELAPDDSYALKNQMVLCLVEHRPAEALDVARRNPADLWRTQGIALASFDLGDGAASDAALAEFQRRWSHDAAFQLAEICAWRGEVDLAFSWLERALVERDPGLAQTRFTPLLARLHGDPRWPGLLARLELPARP